MASKKNLVRITVPKEERSIVIPGRVMVHLNRVRDRLYELFVKNPSRGTVLSFQDLERQIKFATGLEILVGLRFLVNKKIIQPHRIDSQLRYILYKSFDADSILRVALEGKKYVSPGWDKNAAKVLNFSEKYIANARENLGVKVRKEPKKRVA